LKWEDVYWQKHLITVRHEVAKQTSRKMGNSIAEIHYAAKAWQREEHGIGRITRATVRNN
jgi:hypothetical protein